MRERREGRGQRKGGRKTRGKKGEGGERESEFRGLGVNLKERGSWSPNGGARLEDG